MKRSARDLDEAVNVDGVLVLPSNVKVRKVSFSLENLSDRELGDMEVVTTIVTHCAMHIAQKHHRIQVFLHSYEDTFMGYQMLEYTVQMLMPPDVPLPNSMQLNSIHNLESELIHKPITLTRHAESGGYVLEVPFASKKNRVMIKRKLLTQIEILEMVPRITYPTETPSGFVKRTRNAAGKAPK